MTGAADIVGASDPNPHGDAPMSPPGGRGLAVRHLWLAVPFLGIAWRSVYPIGDNSFLWHVRAGEVQLASGEVLRVDPFSFTHLGEPWRTQSWLIELMYGWLHELTGGLQWVPTMLFLVVGGTLGFVGLAIYHAVRDPLRTAVLLAVVAWVGSFFAVPRPVVASFLLLAVATVIVQHSERAGWAVVPLLWLWAAVHGSFVLGVGYLVLESLRRRSRRLGELTTLGAAVTLLTAHGFGAWQIFVDFLRSRDALSYLSEWARPDFTDVFLAPALLVGALVVVAFLRRRLALGALVVAVPFAVFGAMAQRSVFPAVIVVVPLAAAAWSRDGSRTRAPLGSSMLNRTMAGVFAALSLIALARPVGFNEVKLPPPEVLAALEPGRVFAGPAAGGMLIYADWQDRMVYIDDRAELYGSEGFREAVAALEGRDYRDVLAALDMEQALLEARWELVEALRTDGWTTTFENADWVVLAAPR